MKKYILLLPTFTALAISSCRKIETDGEKEVIIITQPGTGGSTGQTITLQGRINADTILRKGNTYILKGLVYMVNNKTMTIEAGTKIKGSFSGADVAALIITRGSKIVAQGSPTDPIVFTSSRPSSERKPGDWGGIVVMGEATTNNFTGRLDLNIESQYNSYGGSKDESDSGILKYVRIEFAGKKGKNGLNNKGLS